MRSHTLIVFVDGLGLGDRDPNVNPVCSGACPSLDALLEQHTVPIDACLGVPGSPQSATGQTALLTGINAAKLAGRHIEGFPTKELRDIIEPHSIFRRLLAADRTCTFANAYYVTDISEVEHAAWKSVTTVATLSAFGAVRDRTLLERNQAVYQDLTREGLRERGYRGRLVTPAQSASHLLGIARQHDLTLFEYFQTDRAGHRADMAAAQRILSLFDAFVGALISARDPALRMVLTSDHGNIETIRRRGHTENPVPFAVVGPDSDALKERVKSLVDITPALVDVIG